MPTSPASLCARARLECAAPMYQPTELPHSQKIATMVGALLGLLLAALDQTIVATAGPFIQKDLQIAPALYVWLTSAYLVASTVLVPIYGKLSDIYGRRRVLLVAIGIFLLGSLACGIAQSATQLIAARAVQGIGSAGLFTSAFAIVADLFPPAERGKWQGMFGAAWGVSSVVGPLLGGVITEQLSWHWTFFVNLPIGAIAVSLIVAKMPPLRRTHERRPKLDIPGAVALAVAVLPLLLALSLGHADTPAADAGVGWVWLSWQIAALLATSLVGLLAFVVIETRATNPILDFKLFRIKTFAVGSLATFIVGNAFLGAIVFLPLFMVNVVGLSATSSGLTTTPLTFGIVAANIVAGHLVSRLGSYKGLLVGSLVIQAASFALLATTLSTDETQLAISLKMVLLGIGLGPAIPLFTLAIQTAVPPPQIGVATAAATFFRQMGTTIGIAILGTVFATSFPSTVASHPHATPTGGAVPSVVRAMLAQQFTDALVAVFWVSFAIAAVGVVVTLVLPHVPLRATEPGGQPPPPPAVD